MVLENQDGDAVEVREGWQALNAHQPLLLYMCAGNCCILITIPCLLETRQKCMFSYYV